MCSLIYMLTNTFSKIFPKNKITILKKNIKKSCNTLAGHIICLLIASSEQRVIYPQDITCGHYIIIHLLQ